MSKVRAEQYTNRLGTGAPEIPFGVTLPEGASIDGAGGLNLTGIATAGTFKGNIEATTASFSGNVSIGGTLTYEDVTNVDSIGLITARSGIRIGAPGANILISGTGSGIGINETTPEELLDLGENNQQNIKVGQRGYLGQGYSTGATILGHSVKAMTTGTTVGGMEVTETNSGGGAPSAIRQDSGIIQFHTASSGTSGATFNNERLRIGPAGQIGLSGANYGTSGQVLTSQGGSAAPQWAEAGGGALEIVETVALGNDFGYSYKDFVGFTTAYQEYRLVVTQLMGADNGAHDPRMHFFMDGTRNTGASSYTSYGMKSNTSGGVSGFNQPNTSAIRINNAETSTQYNMTITINQRPTHGSGTANNAWPNCYAIGNSNYQVFSSFGRMNDTADSTKNITGVRLFYGDGTNFAHGRLTLYRLKYS